MKVVVVYDITEDKKRNLFAKELLMFGIRTQKSVFECDVTQKELEKVKKIAHKYTKKKDKVGVYEFLDVDRFGDVEYIEVDDFIV